MSKSRLPCPYFRHVLIGLVVSFDLRSETGSKGLGVPEPVPGIGGRDLGVFSRSGPVEAYMGIVFPPSFDSFCEGLRNRRSRKDLVARRVEDVGVGVESDRFRRKGFCCRSRGVCVVVLGVPAVGGADGESASIAVAPVGSLILARDGVQYYLVLLL